MKLADWLKAHTHNPVSDSRHEPAIGIADFIGPTRMQLWGLEDYRVTTVSGGTIWLMPKDHDRL